VTIRRVLVPGAGSGQSNNLIRGLRAADPTLAIIGAHYDRFSLTQSPADHNYVVPAPEHPRLPDALCRLAEQERVDLLIPTRDWEVSLFASLAPRLPGRLFLPPPDVIALCQDKQRLTALLETDGLPVPRTFPIATLDDVDAVFARFPAAATLWCRSRFGADSRGATAVRTPDQARAWISYWQDMRGYPVSSFTLGEYLPGRDYACQSLWRDGRLVLVKTYERLDYLGGYSRPSGVASQSSLAKNVFEPKVVEISSAAVRLVDPHARGAFDVDLKSRADGTPAITEINAGRFLSSQPIFDFTGSHNMTRVFLQVAFGDPVDLHETYDAAPGWYMVRDFDALPGIVHEDDVIRHRRPSPGA
jgi:biotin carboxylase